MPDDLVQDENDFLYDTHSFDLVSLVRSLFERIFEAFTGGNNFFDRLFDTLAFLWDIYSIIAIILSLLFIAGFIYAKIRFAQLAEIESQRLLEAEAAWAHAYGGEVSENNRWKDIQNHIASENPSDWRLGIIEADILLEEALDNAGYLGASVGDRLKTINPAQVASLQDAWDAHLVRNQIAHQGTDFVLTKRMANEAMIKYERFLRELGAL